MSLSNPESEEKHFTGRVVMGMDTPGPDTMSIQELEGKRQCAWDSNTDEDYIARVKKKAENMARDILSKAMTEAAEVREQAKQQGYEEGLALGQDQVNAHIAALTNDTSTLLQSVADNGVEILQQRHEETLHLIRLAVAHATGIEMSENRQQSLSTLLREATEHLEATHNFVISVNPEDYELMQELLEQAKIINPTLGMWNLKTDPQIGGGVIIETNQGMVENTTDSRWQEVENILSQMALLHFEEPAPQAAEAQQEQQPEEYFEDPAMPMGMPDAMMNQDEPV
ncbi:MAG: FliH/SctL family protein [Desulfovibrio sp.]